MNKARPPLQDYLMNIARIVASRSTCSSHLMVGAVATRDGRIISTGYNGVPSGNIPHCDSTGCVRLGNGKHAYLVHAEENIIAQAARYGVALEGATIYVTHLPCTHCAAMLIQAKVSMVVYGDLPENHNLVTVMYLFDKADIICLRYL